MPVMAASCSSRTAARSRARDATSPLVAASASRSSSVLEGIVGRAVGEAPGTSLLAPMVACWHPSDKRGTLVACCATVSKRVVSPATSSRTSLCKSRTAWDCEPRSKVSRRSRSLATSADTEAMQDTPAASAREALASVSKSAVSLAISSRTCVRRSCTACDCQLCSRSMLSCQRHNNSALRASTRFKHSALAQSRASFSRSTSRRETALTSSPCWTSWQESSSFSSRERRPAAFTSGATSKACSTASTRVNKADASDMRRSFSSSSNERSTSA
mmetsp:Transcript_70331/g.194557  ORF Transcript_70331/g.194557 Transcript_70331/m.194557 type:complete len:274 (+) Transcript_70331:560-1381(+)